MAENIADTTVKNEETSVNWEERAKKAEAKIVELKTQDETKAEDKPEPKSEEKVFTKEDLKKAIKEEMKEFHIQNQEDKYQENINETNSSSIWTEDAVVNETFSLVEANEYLNMNTKDKENYRAKCLSEFWELSVL